MKMLVQIVFVFRVSCLSTSRFQMEAERRLLLGNALKPELLLSRVKRLRLDLYRVCCAGFFSPLLSLSLPPPVFVRYLWIPSGWVRQMCLCVCVCGECVRHSLPVFTPSCWRSLVCSWIFWVLCRGLDPTQSPAASARTNWSSFLDSWPPPGIFAAVGRLQELGYK